jgi:hypothetical protein
MSTGSIACEYVAGTGVRQFRPTVALRRLDIAARPQKSYS